MPVRALRLALIVAGSLVAAGCATPPPSPAAATVAPATAPALPGPSSSAESTNADTPSEAPTPAAAPTARPPVPAGMGAWLAPCQQGIASVDVEVTGPTPEAVTPVVAVGDGGTGAILAVAPMPDDATELLLGACLWAPSGGDGQPLINAGTVGAALTPGLSLQRIVRTQGIPVVHVLAGRATPEITAVEVTLADGTAVAATVADGYWIALWTGPSGSTQVAGRDASAAAVTTIPIDDMAP